MEKYLIDRNRNRVIAHANRLSDTPIGEVITLQDGSFAVKITIGEKETINNINVVDELPKD